MEVVGRNVSSVGLEISMDTLKVLTPLEGWRDDHFESSANTGNGADDEDPDADGASNLIEYMLGQDPKQRNDITLLPVVSAGDLQFVFKHPVPALLDAKIEVSDDLILWESVAHIYQSETGWILSDEAESNWPSLRFNEMLDNLGEQLQVELKTDPDALLQQLFYRIQVGEP